MNILIVGGGGREHALAWKAAQAPYVEKVYVAPGNAGTAMEEKCENVDIEAEDTSGLREFAERTNIDLTIVGPEQPLVNGIVDVFEAYGLACFGPSAAAARLEGSKAYAKDFCARYDIPTASYGVFGDFELSDALACVREHSLPVVVKADGLATGKGVTVAKTREDAEQVVRECLEGGKFGDAGRRIVIEDFIEGEEVSFIAVVSEGGILPLATSQDHKPRDDGDEGPNTGGMGAYSPAPIVTPELYKRIMTEIMIPTMHGMKKEGRPYCGFLYAGLKIDPSGNPKVLEFNCRLGDPETQPILMRMNGDLVQMCGHALAGSLSRLQHFPLEWDPRPALGVVMAANGYPESHTLKGEPFQGLHDVVESDDLKVFHAGTTFMFVEVDEEDSIGPLTNGGRVLCVTALGQNIKECQSRVYEEVKKVDTDGGLFYRTDIGDKALSYE